MKNLKKVLALVLAFACAFTMFAGAAFTDQADISQTEAVDMLSALGVINGYSDGSFAPDATITRAEAAKMIYTIWNGGSDDASAFEWKSQFTDVYSGHWAEGYINFCYTNGIINGLSATQFGPGDPVTGTQLAKMLLICMGYQADKSGLEGTGYSQRTNALATQNGLYVDVATSVSQAMPRQFAAQLMYNALKADTVVWSSDRNAYEKVETTSYEWVNNVLVPVTDYETMGKKCMGLTTQKTLLTSVSKEEGRDTYSLNGGDYTRVANDYSNLIGQNVNVLVKNNDTSKVYGVYAHEDSEVVASGYVGQMETVTDTNKIKLAGTEYKLAPGADITDEMVYEINDDTASTTVTLDSLAQSMTTRARNDAASEIKLIDNTGDGKIDLAVYTPVQVGQVAAVTKTTVTINGVGTRKFADDTIYEDIAKDDYVRVIDDTNVAEGGDHVEKLDVTNVAVDGTRTGEARVDGTWYKLAQGVNNLETGSTYDLVIVGNTILYADKAEGSSTDVAYIQDVSNSEDHTVGDSNYTSEVRMYFADGTNAAVKVSKVAGDKLAQNDYTTKVNPLANKMVTYSKLSDGTYDVKALANDSNPGDNVDDSNLAGCDRYVDDATLTGNSGTSAYYDSKIGGVSIADDAVVFVEAGDETKVLTGAQVKSWSKDFDNLAFAGSYLTETTNGIEYIQAAALTDESATVGVPGSKDMLYAYATVNSYEGTLNGEKKTAVIVWNGTDEITLWADGSELDNIQAGDLFGYKLNGDFVEGIVEANHRAAVLGFDGKAEGELRVVDFDANDDAMDAGNTYTLAEDCVILTVDDAANKGMDGAGVDSIIEAGYEDMPNPGDTDRNPNVRYILGIDIGDTDNANKVVAIVIDSESNELA